MSNQAQQQQLPEPRWATEQTGVTGTQGNITRMHNALLAELRLLTIEQQRTNQLLEWLGGLLAQNRPPDS